MWGEVCAPGQRPGVMCGGGHKPGATHRADVSNTVGTSLSEWFAKIHICGS